MATDSVKVVVTGDNAPLKETLKDTEAALKKTAAENEAASRVADAAAQRHIASLEREIALFGTSSKEAQALWEIEHGRYASLEQASKDRIVALARQADAVKAAAAEASRAAAAEASAVVPDPARLKAFQDSLARSLQGATGEVGKLGNALGRLAPLLGEQGEAFAKAAKAGADALSAFAGGGALGLGLSLVTTGVGLVVDKLTEQKRAAEASARAMAERAKEAQEGLDKEVAALDKVLARERALQVARAKGISEESAARELRTKELQEGLDRASGGASGASATREELGRRIEAEEAALRELKSLAVERMDEYGNIVDAALSREIEKRKATLNELRALNEKAISDEGTAWTKKESAKTQVETVEAEKRIEAELARQRRIEQAQRDRASAERKLLEQSVASYAKTLEGTHGLSAGEARAKAELAYADALITTTDKRARALELQVLENNAADAHIAVLVAQRVEREQKAESTIKGLEREIALLGLSTEAEKARWEVTNGSYADYDQASKDRIVRLAEERDAKIAVNKAEKEAADAAKKAREDAAREFEQAQKQFASELKSLQDAAMSPEQRRDEDIRRWTAALNEGTVVAHQYAEAVALIEAAYAKANAGVEQLRSLAVDAAQSMTDHFIDGFFDPQRKSWADWFTDVSKQISKAIAKILLMKAIEGIGNTLVPGAGTAAAQVVGGVRAAGGGHITGPGTATSDSIPAWLSNGEFVQRAAAVDHYGVGMMRAINELRWPKFASGGLVGAAPAAAGGGGRGGGTVIQNVLDPSVMTSAMQSSEGNQIILNVITANRDAVRSALG